MKLVGIIFSVACVGVVIGKTKLPSGMTQHQYCHGCIAVVKELEKMVSRRHITAGNRESKIMEMMEKICSPQNFVEYDYSPPKTQRACELLLEHHEEDVESAFVKEKPKKEKLLCHDISQACEGVDLNAKDKKTQFADIDLTSQDGQDTVSKTVKIDPGSGKGVSVEDDTKHATKNEGKTISKKEKKKTKKKKSTKKTEKKKKEADEKATGTQKGGIHHMNVDINDPSSMEKIMAQIQDIKDGKDLKDEL